MRSLFLSFVLFLTGSSPQAWAANGRRCTLTIVSAQIAKAKPNGTTWDRTEPGTPDPKVRVQVGGYLFNTKMACNTHRPVFNEKFEACLDGREDATIHMTDVDSATEDVIGSTHASMLSTWFERKLFRKGGSGKALLRFGSVVLLEMKLDCSRRSCRPPRRKQEKIKARISWKVRPPRFLVYQVAISPEDSSRYKKEGLQMQLSHWVGGKEYAQVQGYFNVPAPTAWSAFPFPLLCTPAHKGTARKARVLVEILGSTTRFLPAEGVQNVICR